MTSLSYCFPQWSLVYIIFITSSHIIFITSSHIIFITSSHIIFITSSHIIFVTINCKNCIKENTIEVAFKQARSGSICRPS